MDSSRGIKCLVMASRLPVILTAALMFACARPEQPAGDAARGKAAIDRYGCTACHTIRGVAGPNETIGPPLDHVASRPMIDGKFPNNPEMMAKWLQNPPAYNPRGAMPNLGVTPADARDIAAYLYTLK